jgi:Skp family chaperone for outer membrane proteins
MKKLFIITASVAMMSICSLAQAQDQDTASSSVNTQPPVEESQQNQGNTQSDDMKTRDAERVDNQQQPQSTDQELQNDVDAMQENFEGATIDKVGPNGEKLFMERGKYFYIDDEGKKVKVKKSEVRDKSEVQPR